MVGSQHKVILASGKFSGTDRDQLSSAFETFLLSEQKSNLLIYFHGGLVSESNAEETAERLLPNFQNAGAYPLFVIWETGLGETLRNNWQEIVKEDIFPVLVNRVLQFIIGKLDQEPGEKGGEVELPTKFAVEDEIAQKQAEGSEPYAHRNEEASNLEGELKPTEQEQFKAILAQDPNFVVASSKLSRDDAPELSPIIEDELKQAKTAGPGEKSLISTTALIAAGVRILARSLERLSNSRDHGIYTTVVEEVVRELKGDFVGGIVWKHIKKDSVDSFGDDGKLFGGTAILEEINKLWQAGHKPRIMLVGHSAGSVYICHFLEEAAKILSPEIKFEVVFLAPACSFGLLAELLNKAGNRISAFRSFGLSDDLEKKDAILPPVYLRSLLYFVSGLLEGSPDLPLLGMERYHKNSLPFNAPSFEEIVRVREFLTTFPSTLVWSSIDGSILNPPTLAKTHGDFDNDEPTLKSIALLITQGWT